MAYLQVDKVRQEYSTKIGGYHRRGCEGEAAERSQSGMVKAVETAEHVGGGVYDDPQGCAE